MAVANISNSVWRKQWHNDGNERKSAWRQLNSNISGGGSERAWRHRNIVAWRQA